MQMKMHTVLFMCAWVSPVHGLDNGVFRLVNGPSVYKGTAETFYGRWGTICNDTFGEKEAKVLCRSLGYSGGKIADYGDSSILPLMGLVHCRGNEYSLEQCFYMLSNPCEQTAVGVDCDPSNMKFRLVNGTNEYSGRVEVFYNQTWGSICDFGNNDNADVACRSLGYSGGVASGENVGSGPIWMSNLVCNGDEYSLAFCPFSGWGNTSCIHEWDMAVKCSPPTGCIECIHMQSCNAAANICTCKVGWTGKYCHQDINECLYPTEYYCPENSTCVNTDGSYYCRKIVTASKDETGWYVAGSMGFIILILALVSIWSKVCVKGKNPYQHMRQPSSDENSTENMDTDNGSQEAPARSMEEDRPIVYGSEGYGTYSHTHVKILHQ